MSLDPTRVAAEMRAAYGLAPTPVMTLLLVRAAQVQTDTLAQRFAGLPSQVRDNLQQWAADLAKYALRLHTDAEATRQIAALATANPDDWQDAVTGAGEYASAMLRFFFRAPGYAHPDSAYWATLANQLEAALEGTRYSSGARKWMRWLIGSWGESTSRALTSDVDEILGEGGKLVEQAEQAAREIDLEAVASAGVDAVVKVGGVLLLGALGVYALRRWGEMR